MIKNTEDIRQSNPYKKKIKFNAEDLRDPFNDNIMRKIDVKMVMPYHFHLKCF